MEQKIKNIGFFYCTFISLFWQNLTYKFNGKLPHANTLRLTKDQNIIYIAANTPTVFQILMCS